MHRSWTLPIALAALSGCADQSSVPELGSTQTTASSRQCFYDSEIRGFSNGGPDRAIVNRGQYDSWELLLTPGCPDVDYAQRIALVARGGNRICSGSNVELVVPDASGTSARRCLVRSVRKLSAEEAAAVRGRTP